MPIYFFHLYEDGACVEDEEGMWLTDDASAREVAVTAARDVLAGAVREGRLPLDDVILVTDHIGQTLFSLRLGAVVILPSGMLGNLGRLGNSEGRPIQ